jgi:thiol-disulfide isomerase/thioredoxin
MLKAFVTAVLSYIKPVIYALMLIGFLQLTGLWSVVSVQLQTLVMKTGALNASVDENHPSTDWDYDFSMHDLNGNIVHFNQLKGEVVFVNLWATWCGPCKAEMPGIQQLYSKMSTKKIKFVMLSIDRPDGIRKVKRYLAGNRYDFPVFVATEFLPGMMQVPSIPTTFIINKKGKVVLKETGARNYDTPRIINFLNKLINE